MHDARWIQAEHNSRPAGKPWVGYDMDWTSCKLRLLNIDDEIHVCYSEFQQISAFEPNCWEPLLYHGQRMCSPFFQCSGLLLSCRTEPIIALSLPPEPCWSWRNPIISHSIRLLYLRHVPLSSFHPPSSVPRRPVSPVKLNSGAHGL